MAFLTIRIDDELKAKLEAAAAKDLRSISGQALFYIYASLNRETVPKTTLAKIAIPAGVTDQTWEDFVQLRKAKKAPITKRAIDGINREALKAGMSLEQALRMCCMRGWAGFKAEWAIGQQDALAAFLKPVRPVLEM